MTSKIMSFQNNNNVGLYIFVNDSILLVGKEVPEKYDEDLKKIFDVPLKRITIAGASFIGVFIAGNNETILVPNIIFEEELAELKETGLNVVVLDTKQTCLGNNIVMGKENILVNDEFSNKQMENVESLFKMPVKKVSLEEINVIGSLIVLNPKKNKGLVGNDITEDDFQLLQSLIGYELTPSSVNMGSPYLKSGIAVNKNGFIIGSGSGGPEMSNAEEGLGFLDEDD